MKTWQKRSGGVWSRSSRAFFAVTGFSQSPICHRVRKGARKQGSKEALCSWGHVTKFFQENFYIMGYNLKNARNERSASKILLWPSLRSLALNSKFIRPFEFSENLEDLYGKCCWRARPCSPTTFSIQNSDCHKISFFNDGGLKLSHFDIFDMPFSFLAFVT